MPAALLSELARVKALFQQRAIATHITGRMQPTCSRCGFNHRICECPVPAGHAADATEGNASPAFGGEPFSSGVGSPSSLVGSRGSVIDSHRRAAPVPIAQPGGNEPGDDRFNQLSNRFSHGGMNG